MKKHWTHYLPEGHRIFRDEVDRLKVIEYRIKAAEQVLSELYLQRLRANTDLRRNVAKQYSEEEIKQAYQEYENESSKHKTT